jgi:hypothetical protein
MTPLATRTPTESKQLEVAPVDEHDVGGEVFQMASYPTLQAAQEAVDDDGRVDGPNTRAASASAATTSAAGAFSVDYEDHPASSVDSDDLDDTRSTTSTTSLLMHPQHKHARDTPQCIIAHDWYECENDESVWLLLIKWKHKPVAECSWEPRDSMCLMSQNKRLVTAYIKQIQETQHIKQCIQRNVKP